MKKRKTVALVPLKANSERVPGKNFRNLAGKPLFTWILDTLLSMQEIDQVIVNTDAREQLESLGLTQSKRLLIRERRAELCGDEVSMNRILEDDIESIDADVYLMTHVTNPFLSAETLRRALSAFMDVADQYDSLFSVNRFQSRFYAEDGTPINHDPGKLIRTQDLASLFEENSCLYLFSRQSFAATGARIGKKPIMFPTPSMESVDIDTQEDWQLAEAVAAYGIANEGGL